MLSRLSLASVAVPVLLLSCHGAMAQALTVAPVTVHMVPSQMATTLTITNAGDTDTAFQLRVLAWSQNGDNDQLSPTDQVLASPPIGSIPAGASQVVRIVLRHLPQGNEKTYRILFDQIPPPAKPGTVRIALRLSIPIFADPSAGIAPHLQWRLERDGGKITLAAVNDGNAHERVRNIALATSAGSVLKAEDNQSPYILAGATRRWRIVTSNAPPALGTAFRLTAQGDAGAIDSPVIVKK